jgi:hypothetical protein
LGTFDIEPLLGLSPVKKTHPLRAKIHALSGLKNFYQKDKIQKFIASINRKKRQYLRAGSRAPRKNRLFFSLSRCIFQADESVPLAAILSESPPPHVVLAALARTEPSQGTGDKKAS